MESGSKRREFCAKWRFYCPLTGAKRLFVTVFSQINPPQATALQKVFSYVAQN
ncbi:MAG: hypothetical protein LBQ80_01185 [Clostridium sp.]|nr:hypothetical protein [Clostridium sp.]